MGHLTDSAIRSASPPVSPRSSDSVSSATMKERWDKYEEYLAFLEGKSNKLAAKREWMKLNQVSEDQLESFKSVWEERDYGPLTNADIAELCPSLLPENFRRRRLNARIERFKRESIRCQNSA